MVTSNKTLEVFVGSTEPFVVELLDDIDTAENLAFADRASVIWFDRVGGTAQLTRSTAAGNLTIQTAAGTLTATITGIEADALVAGNYVAQAAVRFGSDDAWKFSRYFRVEVFPRLAPKV